MNKLLIIGGIVVIAVLALVIFSPADDAMTDPMAGETAMNQEDSMAAPNNPNSQDNQADTTNPNDTETQDFPPEADGTHIIDVAEQTDSLSTLVEAVGASGDLIAVLSSEGPYTVLAPQNSAFEALPAGTLDTLLQPGNVGQLETVLSNHVISGVALSSDLTDGMTVTTLAGEELLVEVGADGVITIGGATVVAADVQASNGVVHIIDTVIVPE